MIDWNPAFVILLLLAVPYLEWLAQRWQYPVDAMLFAYGTLAATVFVHLLGGDTGLRWYNFKPVILNIFLPAMVFTAVMKLPLRTAKHSFAMIVWLALPLGLAGAVAIATGIYHAIDHDTGFPWMTALVAGALLAAVDPGPVLALGSARLIPQKLRLLLAGESLFKDVTCILLFSVLLSLPVYDSITSLPSLFAYHFIEATITGAAAGFACGYIGSRMMSGLRQNSHSLAIASVITAYGAFMLSTHLGGSGIVAVLLAAMVLRLAPASQTDITSLPDWRFSSESWEFAARMMERLMFMLGGATLTVGMFINHWLTMLYAIAMVLLVRALMLLLTWLVLRLAKGPGNIIHHWRHAAYVLLGSGSGIVTLSLVLALPLDLVSWYTVQSAAYGVVIFYLFVQTPVVSWLTKRGVFNTN